MTCFGGLGRELVLASGSAVRRRLLTRAGLTFRVDAPDLDESPLEGEAPFDRARRLAREKALLVSTRWPGALVLGSDQVGVIDDTGHELQKCWEEDAAVAQLCAMSGRAHTFTSAAAIVLDGQVQARRVRAAASVAAQRPAVATAAAMIASLCKRIDRRTLKRPQRAAMASRRACHARSRISRTAFSIPTEMARATMECPMFSSSISTMDAM